LSLQLAQFLATQSYESLVAAVGSGFASSSSAPVAVSTTATARSCPSLPAIGVL
jgi:hypothetical protein